MKASLYRKIIFWSIALICISTLWMFQYEITTNIPWWDDFHGIMLPVAKLFSNAPLHEKITYFFSLNNEHRVVNDRIFMLLVYLIHGSFELKTLALLGFINLILIFILLYKVSRPYVANILFLTPIIFIIFQAQYFEGMQSLMVPFQNFSVILYVLLAFYFLIFNSRYNFLFAMFFAIAAIFTHGNGILAFIIGTMLLFFQLKYKRALQWVLLSIFIISLYFIGYSKPQWSTSSTGIFENPVASLLMMFEFLGAYATNIVELSNYATYSSNLIHSIPIATGILFVSLFLYIIFRKYPIWSKNINDSFNKLRHSKTDLFIISSILFFLATAFIIGLTRVGFPIFSRYTINSAFFVTLVYLLVLFNFKKNQLIVFIFSIVTFSLLIFSYFNNYDEAIYRKKLLITDGINWQSTGTWMNLYNNPKHIEFINPMLKEVYENKKYVFPYSKLKNINVDQTSNIDSSLHFVLNVKNETLQLQATSNISDVFDNENGIYFILKSKNMQFIFPVYYTSSNIYRAIVEYKYQSNNYKLTYLLSNLPKDIYQINKIEIEGLNVKKSKSEFVIDTKNLKLIKRF